MMTDISWNEFCELYYESAMKAAEINLQRLRKKTGEFDKRVDLDYVKDAAVLAALEKAYSNFDSTKGVRITTFISSIVHNEIVDEVTKESKAAAAKQDIEDVKTVFKEYTDDDRYEARAALVPRMMAAIAKLPASDQVILNFYLEDKSSYIGRSAETLHVSEGYVSVRRHHIFKRLQKLMEMSPEDYLRYCLEFESAALASSKKVVPRFETLPSDISFSRRAFRLNPILPSLDLERMAKRLLEQA